MCIRDRWGLGGMQPLPAWSSQVASGSSIRGFMRDDGSCAFGSRWVLLGRLRRCGGSGAGSALRCASVVARIGGCFVRGSGAERLLRPEGGAEWAVHF
eukprot:13926276-Alexandrium_andersonii.AAC.1